jgi:hypothetical protein
LPSKSKSAFRHRLANPQNHGRILKAVSLNIAEQKNFPATPPELQSVHQYRLDYSRWNTSMLA